MSIDLIFLLAATPPATTNILSLTLLFFSYSLNPFLVFLYRIFIIVFWKDAAISNLSCSFLIFLLIFNIAVFNPAKDKLHPPLLNILIRSNNYHPKGDKHHKTADN